MQNGLIDDRGRVCLYCGEWQSWDHFSRNKSSASGYQNRCKVCFRAYRAANKERKREVDKLWYKNNPDKLKAIRKRYYWHYPEKARAQSNQPQKKVLRRLWAKNNPDRVQASVRLRRARKLAAEGSFTVSEWVLMQDWFENRCLCCGAQASLQPDHVVPLAKGGTNWINNIQPLCGPCNYSKSDVHATDYRDPDQLASFLTHLRNAAST